MDQKGRSDLVHAKVSKLTWNKKVSNKSSSIKDSAGNLITDSEEIKERWRVYIESLYDKDGKPKIEELQVEADIEVIEDDKGPTVLKSEILAAIKELKEGKAVRVDEIPAEIWKRMRDKALIEMCEL